MFLPVGGMRQLFEEGTARLSPKNEQESFRLKMMAHLCLIIENGEVSIARVNSVQTC